MAISHLQQMLQRVPGGNPALNPAVPAPAAQQAPQKPSKPFSATPPSPSYTIPRSDQVIRVNTPTPRSFTGKLSQVAQRHSLADAGTQFELDTLKQAHEKYISQTGGGIKPFPYPRDIKVGNTVIPAELVKRIGRWSIKVPPLQPEQFKRPDEVW